MGNETKGSFLVGELDDGRFVAIATNAPYFCFRAESEAAVVAKVKRALTYCKSRTDGREFSVNVKSVSNTITTVRPGKRIAIEDIMEAA